MKYFALLLVALSLEAHAATQGADRIITWREWQESEFRVGTGYRYLGHGRWEHYLGFELYRPSSKKIKISMISLGHGDRARRCHCSKKTLRNSQSHKLDVDGPKRPLELDCTGDAFREDFVSRVPLIQ